MDFSVFLAVLLAAACHAGWNALIKGSDDRLTTAGFVAMASGLVSLLLLPIVGLPNSASIPWAIGAALVHLLYFVCLIEAYDHGDLGQVYPLARGSAPLMTGVMSSLFIEQINAAAWAGLLLLAFGVLILALPGREAGEKFNRRAGGFALATAVTICGYSITDGLGARVSGNPTSYTLLLFIDCAIITPFYVVARKGRSAFNFTGQWRAGLPGGMLQVFSYGIAIWAMTLAPIAVVAALRETSVLFGAIIAVVVLKEPFRASRLGAAAMVFAGLFVLRIL